jgi:hypothetical protein
MDKIALFIGIFGGFGLGLLLGSEFTSSYVTLLGAGIIIISIFSIAFLSYLDKKSC